MPWMPRIPWRPWNSIGRHECRAMSSRISQPGGCCRLWLTLRRLAWQLALAPLSSPDPPRLWPQTWGCPRWMRTVWFGFKLRGIRFRVRIRIPQFLPRQRGEAFEFEFQFEEEWHCFPWRGEGGVRVRVRVREVAPREGAGGGSSSSNSARKQHKILISTWERGIRVQFEFRFGRSCRGGGSSSLNSLRNMCFLEGYVGIVGSMLCDYSIVDSYKHLIDIHSII